MDGDNVRDSLKALEEVRLDAEKGMFMFDGAMKLLCRQEEDSSKTGSCAVCRRNLESKKLLHQCSRLLQTKRATVLKIRNDEAVLLHESCVAAMHELGNRIAVPTPSTTRLAFYLRTGELSEWRQQKMDCMTNMGCFACARGFTPLEFSEFLKRVDHRAAVMERELHIHPKFCPIQQIKSKGSNQPQDQSSYENSSNTTGKRGRWTNTDQNNAAPRKELII